MKHNNKIAPETARLIEELRYEASGRSLDIVKQAIQFALECHKGQNRASGEPQVNHAFRVGIAVAKHLRESLSREYTMTPSGEIILICGGILHDVLEDTEVTDEELCEKFSKEPGFLQLGREIARTVRAVSHEEEEEPDEVYLSRVAEGGMLAVLIKRFDRLDNLQTLVNVSASFRTRKLAEVREALPIWRRIDPEGVRQIEKEMKRYFSNWQKLIFSFQKLQTYWRMR